jgi:hypothetical protein
MFVSYTCSVPTSRARLVTNGSRGPAPAPPITGPSLRCSRLSNRSGLPAGATESENVNPVAVGSEAFRVGEGVELIGDGALEGSRGGDVDDLPAPGAEEVMVVLGQVLDQLEAGELIVGGYPTDNRSSLQVDQVAVGAASGQVG